MIGVYRWSVWVFKALAASLYRPRLEAYEAPFSIVCPVYMEPPDIFRQALESWLLNRPTAIVASIYYTDQECVEVFRELELANPGCKFELLIRDVSSKRHALAQGIEKTTTEIVALVDSDSIWESNVVPSVFSPFADPKVGGVITRQQALNLNTIWGRMFGLYLNNRFSIDIPAQARLGNALSCLSGRTAFYRGDFLRKVAPTIPEETFWGETVISGEDKFLTTTLYGAGFQTAYQGNVQVWTDSPNNFKTFFGQRLRWTRNSFRSDLKGLSRSWAWRRPFLAFFMADRFIATFTILLSPIYLIYMITNGLWLAAGVLIIWWHLGRVIRFSSHLRHHPKDLQLVPIFVLLTYLSGIVRVYALLTMWNQGWLTRPQENHSQSGALRKVLLGTAATMTVLSVFGMASVIWALRAV